MNAELTIHVLLKEVPSAKALYPIHFDAFMLCILPKNRIIVQASRNQIFLPIFRRQAI